MSAVDNWNVDDWFPNLDLGQKVVVAYNGKVASDLLMNIALNKYGASRVVLVYVAINPRAMNLGEYNLQYMSVIECSAAHDCQKIFIDKRHIPNSNERGREIDFEQLLVSGALKSGVSLVDPIVYVGTQKSTLRIGEDTNTDLIKEWDESSFQKLAIGATLFKAVYPFIDFSNQDVLDLKAKLGF